MVNYVCLGCNKSHKVSLFSLFLGVIFRKARLTQCNFFQKHPSEAKRMMTTQVCITCMHPAFFTHKPSSASQEQYHDLLRKTITHHLALALQCFQKG